MHNLRPPVRAIDLVRERYACHGEKMKSFFIFKVIKLDSNFVDIP